MRASKVISALRKDAKPTLDEASMEMLKTDVKKLYGWDWPAEMDLVTGAKALFEFLIAKHELKNGRRF